MNLTVHNYIQNSTVLSRASQDNLLSQGRTLLQHATSNEGWTTTNILPSRPPQIKTTVYRYTSSPPSTLPGPRIYDLKEWDSPLTHDEIFSLNDLDDFLNTDFSSLFRNIERKSDAKLLPPTSTAEKHVDDALSSEPQPQLKRRKLETGALYGFIPKPHVHPSPFSASPSIPKGKPFAKTEPAFIIPNISFSLPHDARVAWLIPIRGALPWEHCTSASFLNAAHLIPTPSSPPTDDHISWTQPSILKFWEFLLRLRDVGKLGPLGISFNCSSQYRVSPMTSTTNMDQPIGFHGHPDISNNNNTIMTDTMPYPQETRLNPSLGMVDYIKVNHDAPCRLYVRNALDAWSYEVEDADGCVKKIRVLKGARLVLVDACSQAIHIS